MNKFGISVAISCRSDLDYLVLYNVGAAFIAAVCIVTFSAFLFLLFLCFFPLCEIFVHVIFWA